MISQGTSAREQHQSMRTRRGTSFSRLFAGIFARLCAGSVVRSIARRLTVVVLAVIGGFTTLGCQTSKIQSFETVRIGMSKSLVVESVGGPTYTRRWHGKDRWIYEFHGRDDSMQEREIQFENGRVIYFGSRIKPTVSAEEQDRRNEERDQVSDRTEQQQVSPNAQSPSIDSSDSSTIGGSALVEGPSTGARSTAPAKARSNAAKQPSFNDEGESKLRYDYYGIEPDPAIERRKVAPTFVPIGED